MLTGSFKENNIIARKLSIIKKTHNYWVNHNSHSRTTTRSWKDYRKTQYKLEEVS